MLGLSIVSVVAGAAIAYVACQYPRHQEAIEAVAGALLIAGFVMLGNVLEHILGAPR
jgi:hypothetical protein